MTHLAIWSVQKLTGFHPFDSVHRVCVCCRVGSVCWVLGANLPLVLSLAVVHLWVGEEDQTLTHDPALTHDPNHLNNDLNHPNNHNLGDPEGLDAHAVNKD